MTSSSQTKECRRCGQTKPTEDFRERKKGTGVRQAWCAACMNDYTNVRRARLVRERRGLPLDHPKMQGSREHKPAGYTFREGNTGYVVVKAPGHHRADRYGWVYEHIVIAEQKYGITVTRDFTVHHVNGDRQDNRPENLELRWGNHGKGADVLPGLLRNPEMRAVARMVLTQYQD